MEQKTLRERAREKRKRTERYLLALTALALAAALSWMAWSRLNTPAKETPLIYPLPLKTLSLMAPTAVEQSRLPTRPPGSAAYVPAPIVTPTLGAPGNLVSSWSGQAALDLAFSPDGKWLAVAGSPGVQMVDTGTWKTGRTLGEGIGAQAVAFSPDGKNLASAQKDENVVVWDLSTAGAESEARLWKVDDELISLAFSPGGDLIAVGTRSQGVRIYSFGRGTLRHTLMHRAAVTSLAFSPDGKWLSSGGEDGRIRLWDLSNGGAMVWEIQGHEGSVEGLDFAPDNRMFISASVDRSLRLWKAADGSLQHTLECGGWAFRVRFLTDGLMVMSAGAGGALIEWSLDGRRQTTTELTRSDLVSLAVSGDGNFLAAGSLDGGVWVLRAGR